MTDMREPSYRPAYSAARCPSRDPWSGDLQCVKPEGHDDEQHVYQGIAWTDADEAVTNLTLTHAEIAVALKAVGELVGPSSPLLTKLKKAHEETKR